MYTPTFHANGIVICTAKQMTSKSYHMTAGHAKLVHVAIKDRLIHIRCGLIDSIKLSPHSHNNTCIKILRALRANANVLTS